MEPLPYHMNLAFSEEMLETYARDPAAVPPGWRAYLGNVSEEGAQAAVRRQPSFRPASIFHDHGLRRSNITAAEQIRIGARQDRVDQLIRAYRVRGHMLADLDPIGRPQREYPELDPEHYGFSEADMDQPFSSRAMGGPAVRTLRQILQTLRDTYCRHIGVQFMHIDDLDVRHWLQESMEGTENRITLTHREQHRILRRLTEAVLFEEFIHKRFPGAKSFSLEGAESLIPLLDLSIEKAGEQGVREIVIGMAHRGRLNVLANIAGKSPTSIFREFEDMDAERYVGRGDVKYHLGEHTNWVTASEKSVHVALRFNPSHLEFGNPVVLGRVRAKQDRLGDENREQVIALLIHGDAAFAGEGVVQESLNLSELEAYRIGGTVHVIVNNQLGFTTSPKEGRSTPYASDVAKMLQSPIFHVNGEDPEAVAQVVRLAMDFRKQFKRDVVIDMYCYRRWGHSEGDEPAFTQPLMYAAIEKHKTIREAYLDRLLELGGVTREEADEIAKDLHGGLERQLAGTREEEAPAPARPSILGRVWRDYRGGADADVPEVDTGVDVERLSTLLDSLTRLSDGFHLHPKLGRLLERRRKAAGGELPLDWATAESLAFATLATEGVRVRMSGQDTARGTFSQRHAVFHDTEDGHKAMPLAHLSEDQAPVEIYNSPLSEAGVLGFEYGYSVAYPDALVLWEAQFGDFCNAAQVAIDQFIASAEDKWDHLSGIVLLLPHGFEGQGPEHSSARLERFLILAAEDNMQVVCPSTPGQYFHVLRRQVHRPWRKPLVVMAPKSLLRLPEAVSSLEDLSRGRFRRILGDELTRPNAVTRVLLCSGKVYYDLDARRRALECEDVAIVRLEQLYPLSEEELAEALAPYEAATRMIWVQEEPENMGAWRYLFARFGHELFGRWPFCGVFRTASSSPATGSSASHKLEQAQILDIAFGKGRRVPSGADTSCSGHPTCRGECLK
jgi:2-oxoglutarate dehydrogenase E1 component